MKTITTKLFVLIIFSGFLFNCENTKKNENTNNEQTYARKTDTIIGYILDYSVNVKNGLRHGLFESYYYIDGVKQGKASVINYKNGRIDGEAYFYTLGEKLITRFENISYSQMDSVFTAKIYVYYLSGKIKEEGEVQTTDELNFTTIMDDSSCCFTKINHKNWKYYKEN